MGNDREIRVEVTMGNDREIRVEGGVIKIGPETAPHWVAWVPDDAPKNPNFRPWDGMLFIGRPPHRHTPMFIERIPPGWDWGNNRDDWENHPKAAWLLTYYHLLNPTK